MGTYDDSLIILKARTRVPCHFCGQWIRSGFAYLRLQINEVKWEPWHLDCARQHPERTGPLKCLPVSLSRVHPKPKGEPRGSANAD